MSGSQQHYGVLRHMNQDCNRFDASRVAIEGRSLGEICKGEIFVVGLASVRVRLIQQGLCDMIVGCNINEQALLAEHAVSKV